MKAETLKTPRMNFCYPKMTAVSLRSVIQCAAFILLVASLTSCYTYKRLPEVTAAPTAVHVNDYVNIDLKSGNKMRYLKVIAIDNEKISGYHYVHEAGKVKYAMDTVLINEITAIKKRKFSTGGTIALSIGLLPVALLIYYLANPPTFSLGGGI